MPEHNLNEKPHVYVPPGEAPPAELVVEDLVVGDGAVAAPGQTVNVHYVGVGWSTRQQFDASWDRNDTFGFRLGAGQVIAGWDEGVAGMKLGGRRRITIPPEKGCPRKERRKAWAPVRRPGPRRETPPPPLPGRCRGTGILSPRRRRLPRPGPRPDPPGQGNHAPPRVPPERP